MTTTIETCHGSIICIGYQVSTIPTSQFSVLGFRQEVETGFSSDVSATNPCFVVRCTCKVFSMGADVLHLVQLPNILGKCLLLQPQLNKSLVSGYRD